MRTLESYGYNDEDLNKILSLFNNEVLTTNKLVTKFRGKYEGSIHHVTMRRLLDKLREQGKVKGQVVGSMIVWNKI